ncbi:Transferase [Macleaya cordata]|uniref:Transferase n=1 Tax=Macleaya cordata TaxID=56857 RepID=A0A200QZG4_MACCD|nr:Transferase [Macleaya cordata]
MNGADDICYVSTSTVRPASEGERTQRIDLTVWDLMCLPYEYMQRGLLYTNPKSGKESKQEVINHLKASLSHTLNHFFPLAGRLAITKHDDGTTSVYINCNSSSSTGAEFIHAAADITVADILVPTYVPRIVHSFFSLKGVMNYNGLSMPLLSVQVTELIDGIFIGCTINHTVCDGTSFWDFLNTWSEISRGGSDQISRLPILERWFPKNGDCPIHLPFSIDDEHFAERYKYIPPPSFEVRIFHFTRETIARLKAKANSEISSDVTTDHNISSFQALLAHVWVAVTRARCLDPKEETSYRLVVGNRARLNPPLPEGYFGSSLLIGEATAKVGELLERGVGWGALLLKKVIMSYNDATIRSYCESWVEKPVLQGRTVSSTLMTGGSPRFNMYGNDFGWGRPVAVRGGISNKRDGKITAIAGPAEGSVDLEACLCLDILKAMADDTEFMEAVTILPPFQNV